MKARSEIRKKRKKKDWAQIPRLKSIKKQGGENKNNNKNQQKSSKSSGQKDTVQFTCLTVQKPFSLSLSKHKL